jgi:hypothetical protein
MTTLEEYMLHKFTLIFVLLATLLTGCNFASPATVITSVPTLAPTLEFSGPTATQAASPTLMPTIIPFQPTSSPVSADQVILDRAAKIMLALKDKDMSALSAYVHPKMGLRFSPYASVKDTDQVFQADIVANLMADKRLYTWGAYYGSGAPIDLGFPDYYSKFVYDVDFANAPQVALNHRLGVSTSIDNSLEYYPGAMVVEYYFPGFDPTLQGMDWRSLRLVFMQDNNTWYLVGIIHDQWTT